MVDIEELKKLNASGLTQKEIIKVLKISRSTLHKTLRRNNMSTPNYHNEIKFDNTVFDKIDTEEKAYWLGFLYADGNVSSTINNVEISLSARDIDHLKKFNIFIKNKADVKIQTSKCNNKEYLRCRLTITSKYFKNQLIKLGCIPNKSLVLKFPSNKIINKKLVNHFIRGYVDGDGSITFTKSGRLSLSIIGTYEFLSSIREIYPQFSDLKKDKRWKNNTYYIICHTNKADEVLTSLYKNATIYLQRKYNRLAVLSSNW